MLFGKDDQPTYASPMDGFSTASSLLNANEKPELEDTALINKHHDSEVN